MTSLNEIRLNRAEELIRKSRRSVKETAAACGFDDQNYFSRLFTRRYGCPPSEYRARL